MKIKSESAKVRIEIRSKLTKVQMTRFRIKLRSELTVVEITFSSLGYNLLKLCLNNFLKLLLLLNVIFGLFPFVELTCISYSIHLHI